MKLGIDSKICRAIIIYCGVIFLIVTPWISKDSFVVPKVVLLFLLAMFLLPLVIKKARLNFDTKLGKIFIVVTLLIFIHMVIVMFISSAPFEQQIFGKSARGLGFITLTSLLILTLAVSFCIKHNDLNFLLNLIVIIFTTSSIYALFQSFGVDFFTWETKTNAIFGTLGNPNFQSSAAAMVLVPCILFAKREIKFLFTSLILVAVNFYVIIKTQSVQGIVCTAIGLSALAIIFLFYRSRFLFLSSIFLSIVGLFVAILAMLNQGPLKGFSVGSFTFYKASIESRGDFWRSSVAATKDHIFFGVGLDSFGDYFTTYRDKVAVEHEFSEFTDNSHNYFLEYAVTGGIPFLLFQTLLLMIVLFAFLKITKNITQFDKRITALFIFWLLFQAQSIISPGSLGLMVFNSVSAGAIIGLSRSENLIGGNYRLLAKKPQIKIGSSNIFLVILAIGLMFSYVNTDRLYLNALNSGDGAILAASAKPFPETTLRYQTVSRLLLENKLYSQSLVVARLAIEFNPKSVAPWAHIFLNPIATLEEKQRAKNELIKLDPNNIDLKNLKIEVD